MTSGSKMPEKRHRRDWQMYMPDYLTWMQRVVLPGQRLCWPASGYSDMMLRLLAHCHLPVGLGFDEADQQRPTKSFSGGWR